MSNLKFKSLHLATWRQFNNIDIEFHDRLTIITGANGSGKSTLIRLLSSHFGYFRALLATPVKKSGALLYVAAVENSLARWSQDVVGYDRQILGEIIYSNNEIAPLLIPNPQSIEYVVNVISQQAVRGLHFDSHQPPVVYYPVGHIPVVGTSVQEFVKRYNESIYSHYQGQISHQGQVSSQKMKEAILAMAVLGEANAHHRGDRELAEALEGFIETLRIVLPESLGFITLEARVPEVVIVTSTGEFVIDAVSGGLAVLIDICWRIYLTALINPSFVVTMDEPENHLHPSMQRTLFERLLEAFPQVQFIVATHSPFVVSSVRESSVYVLRYLGDPLQGTKDFLAAAMQSRVFADHLDRINKAGSANEILREVLGVEATVPNWVLDGVDAIADRYADVDITPEVLSAIRSELREAGYGDQFARVIDRITSPQ